MQIHAVQADFEKVLEDKTAAERARDDALRKHQALEQDAARLKAFAKFAISFVCRQAVNRSGCVHHMHI